MNRIYLDHNATGQLLPEVQQVLADAYAQQFANPSSQHAAGRQARRVLDDARESIAEMLGAELGEQADRLVFTSGGTEANNLAIFGTAGSEPGRLIVSPTEHPTVLQPADRLRNRGWDVEFLRVDSDGRIDLDSLAHSLKSPASLVAVMLGNNETGVLQPLDEVSHLCRAANVPLHCDAVQAVGKTPVNFRELGCATLSIAAHKLHGPRGIGALLVGPDVPLEPLLAGGHQELGIRPGTESVVLALGMQAALAAWHRDPAARALHLTELRDTFEAAILSGFPEAVVHAHQAPRLPHTSNIAFVGLNRQALLMAIDMAGIACSTGSACASGSTDASPTLIAMGCSVELLESSLRFSFGATNAPSDGKQAAERILSICMDLRGSINVGKMPTSGPQRG